MSGESVTNIRKFPIVYQRFIKHVQRRKRLSLFYKRHWFRVQFLPWQAHSKHVLARFAWNNFLSQVFVFRHSSNRKESPKWKLDICSQKWPKAKFNFCWINSWTYRYMSDRTTPHSKCFSTCIICILNFQMFRGHAPHGLLNAIIWLVRLLI